MEPESEDEDTNDVGNAWLWSLLQAVVIAIPVALVWLILVRHSQEFTEWAGFGAHTTSTGQAVEGKTLWDWLELFIIPATLAFGGYLLNNAQKAREEKISDQRIKEDRKIAAERTREEREIAEERTQETVLQTYLDQMSKLLIDKLLSSEPKPETKDVARVWTLTVLRRVNGERKGIVLRFLYESALIQGYNPKVVLADADLGTASLSAANLAGVDLHDVYLAGADLRSANLSEANLSGSFLVGANLQHADLQHADLHGANFDEATLWGANFSGTNLSGVFLGMANLSGANLSGANLSGAFLGGADLGGGVGLDPPNFSGANLGESFLCGAFLGGVNFSAANLSGADLNGARFTKTTLWPEGFKPAQAGAKSARSKADWYRARPTRRRYGEDAA